MANVVLVATLRGMVYLPVYTRTVGGSNPSAPT